MNCDYLSKQSLFSQEEHCFVELVITTSGASRRSPNFSWQRAAPVILGRFAAGRRWKINNKWYT